MNSKAKKVVTAIAVVAIVMLFGGAGSIDMGAKTAWSHIEMWLGLAMLAGVFGVVYLFEQERT